MNIPRAAFAFVACVLLAFPPRASASEYRMSAGSSLQFTSSYDGESFDGFFARFTPTIHFDPDDLAAGRMDVRIDLASASTGHEERDEVLVGEEFFDAGGDGVAHYSAVGFRALGGGRFVADGMLTLRGTRLPVALEFTWTPGPRPVLDGVATVRRLDFGVGAGEWADTSLLPDGVKVTTRLVLEPARAARQPRSQE